MLKGMLYLEVFICVRSMLRIRYFVQFCTPMYTCHLWWNYKAQSFHKLKVAFNNAFTYDAQLTNLGPTAVPVKCLLSTG